MTPSEKSHQIEKRRSHHACLPCRRKKIRCPNERPACSNCTRLKQSCSYPSVNKKPWNEQSEQRLAQLEEKLDLLIGNLPNQTSREPQTHIRDAGASDKTFSATPPASSQPESPTVRLSPHNFGPGLGSDSRQLALSQAIQLYFQYFHRQPIWCFEREDVGDFASLPDELVYSVFALTSRFSKTTEQSTFYSNNAKRSIAHRIANGTVEMTTVESVCLLAYSYIIDGDIHLGQFQVGLGLQLCRSAMLDLESTYDIEDPSGERKKRLFWSLQLLEQSYGRQTGLFNTSTDIWRPFFSSTHGDKTLAINLQKTHAHLPIDSLGFSTPVELGIWNVSVHLGWVWSRVRQYVSKCAHETLEEPWRHNSMYSLVLSDFMEAENQIPMYHRYDTVKFYERNAEELKVNRDYWAPWLKEQFVYNTIQTVLNHPFLYILGAQQNPALAIPNSFWRRSSELALIHSTWTVRLIDMIWDKEMTLSDPFFGHAAAIAATIHLYYSCAANARLRYKSIADFAKCRKFLQSFVHFSPACKVLKRKLDDMTEIAVGSEIEDAEHWIPSKIYLNTRLMWDILQFECTPESQERTAACLLGPSLERPVILDRIDESYTLEVIVATSPEISVDTADGGQDRPMPSFKTPASLVPQHLQNTLNADMFSESKTDNLTLNTTPWLWADPSQSVDTFTSDHSIPSFAIGSTEGMAWWNFGNMNDATFNHI